jgi:hypothetical protein
MDSYAEDSTKPVFRRSWTNAEVEMDCSAWTRKITMKNGSASPEAAYTAS